MTTTRTPLRTTIARHAPTFLLLVAGVATFVACLAVLRASILGPHFMKQTEHAIRDMMERGLLNRDLYAQQYLAKHGKPSKIRPNLPNDPIGSHEVTGEFFSGKFIGEQGPWHLTALAAAPISFAAAFVACRIIPASRRRDEQK